ncbi:MAG TPA: DUF374 domain-containing protein [Pirellulaceae bacterium]
MRSILQWIEEWLTAWVIAFLRASCRIRIHNDPRPALRADSQGYAYSVLHAHQVAAILGGEPGTGTIVSRSRHGGLLVSALRARGIVPIRGSTNRHGRDKGGRAALDALIVHARRGDPVLLAVDGPRGPRNHVQPGIAVLSRRTGASVINVVSIPRRRWVLSRTWDRLQIPVPFSSIDVYFGDPLYPQSNESLSAYCERIEQELNALEHRHDPDEATRRAA